MLCGLWLANMMSDIDKTERRTVWNWAACRFVKISNTKERFVDNTTRLWYNKPVIFINVKSVLMLFQEKTTEACYEKIQIR